MRRQVESGLFLPGEPGELSGKNLRIIIRFSKSGSLVVGAGLYCLQVAEAGEEATLRDLLFDGAEVCR